MARSSTSIITLNAVLILALSVASTAAHAFASFGSSDLFPAYGSAVEGSTLNSGQGQCTPALDAANLLATYYGFGSFDGSTCFHDVGSLSASNSNGSVSSSASAQADLLTGVVSASASGTNFGNFASGSALIWDTLTFSGAAPGATATITMSGNATLSGQATLHATSLLLPADVGLNPIYLLENGYAIVESLPSFDGSTYIYQQTFQIMNDTPMLFAIGVGAYADTGGDALSAGSASITDPFTLTLPQGVTYTSAVPLPEPGTLALLLAGMGMIGIRFRRGY